MGSLAYSTTPHRERCLIVLVPASIKASTEYAATLFSISPAWGKCYKTF
jgi:hypothetical protein